MISSAILLHQIGGEIMLLLVYNLWEKIITGSKDGQSFDSVHMLLFVIQVVLNERHTCFQPVRGV